MSQSEKATPEMGFLWAQSKEGVSRSSPEVKVRGEPQGDEGKWVLLRTFSQM